MIMRHEIVAFSKFSLGFGEETDEISRNSMKFQRLQLESGKKVRMKLLRRGKMKPEY
jgi:hypothetical protein